MYSGVHSDQRCNQVTTADPDDPAIRVRPRCDPD